MTDLHQELRDDLAAFALGALTEADAEALRRHLAGCAGCRNELRWLEGAADVLTASVEQLDPPRRLKRRVMAAVRAEPRGAPRREQSPARGVPWPLRAVAVAAGAAVVALAGYGLGRAERVERVPLTVAEAPARAPSAVLLRRGDSATLSATRLAPPRRGVYQAWIRHGNVITPSTVFVPDRNGAAAVAIPSGLDGADEVMVSREPPGGSERPSSAPVLSASLG